MKLKGLINDGNRDRIASLLSAAAMALAAADIHRAYTTEIVCESKAKLNPNARSSMTAVIGSMTCWREKINASN